MIRVFAFCLCSCASMPRIDALFATQRPARPRVTAESEMARAYGTTHDEPKKDAAETDEQKMLMAIVQIVSSLGRQ